VNSSTLFELFNALLRDLDSVVNLLFVHNECWGESNTIVMGLFGEHTVLKRLFTEIVSLYFEIMLELKTNE